MRKIALLPVMFFLWVTLAAGEAGPVPAEPLPVKKVVFFKHGMGYIEREGKIKDNAKVSLSFRADQMKDLLTSFFALDLGGGKISSVQYETRDPLSKQLKDILITVPEQAALSQFLAQLKGARLTAKSAWENISGRILGIEPTNEIAGGKEVKKGYRLVLLTDEGTIRSLDLFAISELTLTDEALQRDLKRLMDLSLDSKYTNRKKLTVSAEGRGERDLRVGYLIEMPIWKCSYRIIFDEKKKDASPLLQGWALAENTTEDDWKDVRMSFVAGNPFSYVMDLYSPYYVQRSQVPIPGLEGLAVNWSAVSPPDLMNESPAAVPAGKEKAAHTLQKPSLAKAGGRGGGGRTQAMDQPAAPPPLSAENQPGRQISELFASSYGTTAQGANVGELFSYEAGEKVSVPRGQAAMVPILSKQINGRRLLFFKESFSPKPTNAFVLRNDTDLTLEAGSITFFEGGTSLGEGILGHTLPPGSQEVVSYAQDASVDINPEQKTHREPHFRGRLVDGILTLTSVETLTNSWKIVNRGKEPATLWLNQPKSAGYHLSKPEKPLKEVDNYYRFEVLLNAGETVDFAVEEKRDVNETVQLAESGEDQIRFYASQPFLSPGAKAFLKELGELMAQKAALQRQINEWNQKTKRLGDEQGRLRSNLESLKSDLPKEQELRTKWVAALAADEDRLVELRAKLDEAGGNARQLEGALDKKLREYKDE